MNITGVAGLGVVALTALLMIIFGLVASRKQQDNLRPIVAFDRLRRAVGLAVENGTRLHISLGKASLFSSQAASGLVGLSVLERIARLSSLSDRPPVATSGDGGLAILSQGTLRNLMSSANALDQFDSTSGRLAGATPLSYIAGAMPVLYDEQVSANILIGSFGPESALLVDAVHTPQPFTMAASDSLPAQAALYACAKEPLIGEELYASGAYLQAGPMHSASLHVEDFWRWVLLVILVVGSILKFLGML